MTDEEKVKARYPRASVMSGVLGGKTKYRVENKDGKRKHRVLGSWRNTQEAAWAEAAKRFDVLVEQKDEVDAMANETTNWLRLPEVLVEDLEKRGNGYVGNAGVLGIDMTPEHVRVRMADDTLVTYDYVGMDGKDTVYRSDSGGELVILG